MIGRIEPPTAASPQAADTPPPKPGRRKKTTGALPAKQSEESPVTTQPTESVPTPVLPNAEDAPTLEVEAPIVVTPSSEIAPSETPLSSEIPPNEAPPPAMTLLPGDTPPPSEIPPNDTPLPIAQPARPAGNNRMLLIGGTIVVVVALLACLVFGTVRMLSVMIPPTATPRANRTPTSEVAKPTNTPNADLGILKTAQAEQDGTATAEANQPTEEPTAEPTEEPTEEPTATEEPTEEPIPDLVSASFTEQEATDARDRHDTEVKTYRQLLFETFEEGNRTKARWNHGKEGRVLANNRYELTIDLPSTYNFDLWKQQPDSLGDAYTVEMEARFLSTSTFSRIGITFDVQEDSTKNWLYLIGSDGNWYVFRDEKRVGSGRLPDKFAINPDTPYVLWVWRLPSGVLFFFNGELVAFVSSEAIGSDFPPGKVGVVGVSGSDDADVPVIVVVDNFLIARK